MSRWNGIVVIWTVTRQETQRNEYSIREIQMYTNRQTVMHNEGWL